MEDKFTIDEIIDVMSKSFDEVINELGSFAKDEKNKDDREIDELKFGMLVHIMPFKMTFIKNLKELKNKE